MSIKVLIVDDNAILRSGVEFLIGQTEDMEIVDQARDGYEGIEFAQKLKPDVVLMDISMPGLNGIDTARKIIRENSEVKILALSAYCNRRFIEDSLKAGIKGYVLKDGIADELVEAIRTINAGQRYLSKEVAKLIAEEHIQIDGSDIDK